MIDWLLIPYMAAFSGWSGGSLKGHSLFPKWTPELFFALGFAYAWSGLIGWWALLAALWAYLWMQTGHANALPWGQPGANPARSNKLQPLVDRVAGRLGFLRFDINWCRTFMAIKGFLIGLPVGGLPLMILWPLGYDLGERCGANVYRETLAGAGAGASILIFIKLVHLSLT